MSSVDHANPKDAAGRAKVPLHLWPATATAAGAVGFLEGELKYGRNNFRAAPVAASVYVAAAKRHLDAWLEREDAAGDTGSNHLGNALACIAILVDAGVNGSLIDDRNFVPTPGAYARHIAQLTEQVARLKKQFGHLTPKHWDARDQMDKQASVNAPKFGAALGTAGAPLKSRAFDANQAATFGPLPTGGLKQHIDRAIADLSRQKREADSKSIETCDCPSCTLERDIKAMFGNVEVEVIFVGEETGLTG